MTCDSSSRFVQWAIRVPSGDHAGSSAKAHGGMQSIRRRSSVPSHHPDIRGAIRLVADVGQLGPVRRPVRVPGAAAARREHQSPLAPVEAGDRQPLRPLPHQPAASLERARGSGAHLSVRTPRRSPKPAGRLPRMRRGWLDVLSSDTPCPPRRSLSRGAPPTAMIARLWSPTASISKPWRAEPYVGRESEAGTTSVIEASERSPVPTPRWQANHANRHRRGTAARRSAPPTRAR